jgi:nucleoside 2-deoxyribosyltransferase
LKKISCFVASTFGKEDVDKIYTDAVLPVLNFMKIKPYRVDKVEHNDDIDDKIIELLSKCDICIADLTFSRPSVYYEAGYFNGLGKQVIFIARKDHFIQKKDDEYGNFRIHFDLQMKNIIKWDSTEEIRLFKKKLQSRLKLILKPLKQKFKEKEEEDLKKSRQYFLKLSPEEKRKIIKKQLHQFFKKKNSEIKHISGNVQRIKSLNRYLSKNDNKNTKHIFSFVSLSATKEYIKYIRYYNNWIFIDETSEHKDFFKQNNYNILCISIRKVPKSRLEDLFPTAKPILAGKVLEVDGFDNLKIRYLFISDINSTVEFNHELEIISQKLI